MTTVPTLRTAVAFGVGPNEYADIGYLNLTGGYATTPDHADLDLTGNVEVVMRVRVADWTPAATLTVFSKWNSDGGNTAYRLDINAGGTWAFYYNGAGSPITTAVDAAYVDNTTYWIRVRFDLSNRQLTVLGAADQVDEPTTYTITDQSGAGAATTIAAGTSSLRLGVTDNTLQPMTGRFYRFILRNGFAGTTALDVDFTTACKDATTVNDTTGKVVTVGGSAAVVSPWYDTTAYTRLDHFKIERGWGDAWNTCPPGQMTLRYSNRDRRFDPDYASSPYVGLLTPRRQVRAWGTLSNKDRVLFTGKIPFWPQCFQEAGLDSYIDVTAYDALEDAGRVRMVADLYEQAFDAIPGASTGFWLRVADGDRWQNSISAGDYTQAIGGVFQSGSTLGAGLQSTPVQFGGGVYAVADEYAVQGETLSWWMQTSAVDVPIFYFHDALLAGGDEAGCNIATDATGRLVVSLIETASASQTEMLSSVVVADGAPHFIVVTWDGVSPHQKLYVDGVEDTLAVWSTSLTNYFTTVSLARIGANGRTAGDISLPTDFYSGTLQDVRLDSAGGYTAAQVASLFDAGRGFVAETAEARCHRLLDDAEWPDDRRAISTNTRAEVGRLVYNGQFLLASLREVEASEQGRLFANAIGDIALLARYNHQEVSTGNTVQAIFSDDGSDFTYATMRFVEDDFNVRNDITVQTPSAQSRSTDSTSKTTYGPQSETVNTILSNYDQARDMAAGLIYWWKDASGRIEPFLVGEPPSAAGWLTLLALDLGYRVSVEQTPMALGSQRVVPQLVSKLDLQIIEGLWFLTVGGQPVPPSFFTLDVSVLDGADLLGF